MDDLWIQARDPLAWVAHWTANPATREQVEQRLGRGRWWVRLREGSADGPVLAERPAPEHEGSAVLHVDQPGRSCVAEMGYDALHAGWHVVARTEGAGTGTHPDATELQVEPGEPPALVAEAPAVGGAQDASHEAVETGPVERSDEVGRTWEAWRASTGIDSAAWVQGGAGGEVRGMPGEGMAGPGPGPVESSSGAWAQAPAFRPAARRFRFDVNVEVIIHGSTEPGARVAVGGRPVDLRADGSFSLRWLLPDGDFRVPVEAVSADGADRREARLRLMRGTTTSGGVGVHGLAAGPGDPITGWAG